MEDISTTVLKLRKSMLRNYRSVVIERVGLEWRVWVDCVTERHMQPRFDTLLEAKLFIASGMPKFGGFAACFGNI